MPKIAVDTFSSRPPFNFGGVYEYTYQMLRQFRTLTMEYGCDVTALVGRNYTALREGFSDSETFRIRTTRWIEFPRFWRYGGFGLQARRCKADVAFFPSPDVLPLLTTPYVVMFHDVAYQRIANFSGAKTARLTFLCRLIARNATRILTNSQCSKDDVIHYYGVADNKVIVTGLSHDRQWFNEEAPDEELLRQLRRRFNLHRTYLLHHGTFQPRKNLTRLVESYHLMLQEHPRIDCDLVLAGNMGWDFQDTLRAIGNIPANGRVILTGGLSNPELAALVKASALVVIPALYEGFCLPMLEAMACGVPTIVANNSCLPEVSGGVLRYFNAESVEEIAETMRSVLLSPSEQQSLRKAGLRRAAEFSWERCANQTLQVLRQAAMST